MMLLLLVALVPFVAAGGSAEEEQWTVDGPTTVTEYVTSNSIDSFIHLSTEHCHYTYYVTDGETIVLSNTFETTYTLQVEASCSLPPTSIEICLTSVFSTMETELSSIVRSLQLHQSSLEIQLHHQHSVLSNEVSWVSMVNSIASSVQSAVDVNYLALSIQIYNLQQELLQISAAYANLMVHLNYLEAEAHNVQEQHAVIYAKYEYVKYQVWTLYSAISAIVYEKLVIEQQQVLIESVVGHLYEQIYGIYSKIEQLNKRELWLASWEFRLYADLSAFEYDVVRFRALEGALNAQELELYIQQKRLLEEVAAVELAVGQLHYEYISVNLHIEALVVYMSLLEHVKISVSADANCFVQAYSDFTCEDSLLYYLACTKTAAGAPYSVSTPIYLP